MTAEYAVNKWKTVNGALLCVRARNSRGVRGVERGRPARGGQAKIEHLDLTIGRQRDVRGFQIAVNDALLVCGFERFSNLRGNGSRLVGWNRTLSNAVGERRSLDQLEHERLEGRLP